ncbi:MAG: N-acetylglucosamine-6-phosphate deacetylase [Woeseiaceae bacterium]|nr:N-acetylglucosamine-6-phosphate deacetylase [Woeseiaceae bacterium]MDX2608336.1 N-acetylglucosamine-6-phosphate deacetylase [Woeseiaceae bacterium]
MTQRLTNCRLFDGEQVFNDRDVVLAGGVVTDIVATSDANASGCELHDLGGNLLAPGLIDLQVNGGGGLLFNDAPTVASLRAIAAAHRSFGTTAFLPTLITDSDAVMDEAVAAVAEAIRERVPGVIGIHLEGPYLNPRYKGVHDAGRMREFDSASMARITSLSDGCTLLTIAPEMVSVENISQLKEQGIVVFGGHSAATYEETRCALDAGLTGFTHLFNAMAPLHSREPGIVGAALEDKDSHVGIIADGYHVHPATFGITVAAKQAGKTVLVTDAMPTVGSDIKSFDLFGSTIRSEGGRCVTADGTLAGSDIGLITAVKNACEFAGIDQLEALRMASAYAADAIGLADQMGYIRPGYRANLIELDASMHVRKSWIDGDMQQYAG